MAAASAPPNLYSDINVAVTDPASATKFTLILLENIRGILIQLPEWRPILDVMFWDATNGVANLQVEQLHNTFDFNRVICLKHCIEIFGQSAAGSPLDMKVYPFLFSLLMNAYAQIQSSPPLASGAGPNCVLYDFTNNIVTLEPIENQTATTSDVRQALIDFGVLLIISSSSSAAGAP